MQAYQWLILVISCGSTTRATLSCDEVYSQFLAFAPRSQSHTVVDPVVIDYLESSDTYEEMSSSVSQDNSRPPSEECQFQVNEAQKSFSIQVEHLIDRLRSFVTNSYFDFRQYELQGKDIQNQLYPLILLANQVVPFAEQFRSRCNFAEGVFLDMSFSIETLKFFKSSRLSGHHLVFYVIDINMRLFNLYDYAGNPDTQNESLNLHILRHKMSLRYIKRELRSSAQLSFGAQVIFDSYFAQALKSLKFLGSALQIQ